MVKREETLLNVMKSVTRNGRSILLTAVFAIILVYLFSIVGFMFFRDDFILDSDEVEGAAATPRAQASCPSGAASADGCNETFEGVDAAAKYGKRSTI